MGNKSVLNKKINHEIAGKSNEDIIHKALHDSGFQVLREETIKHDKFNQKMGERTVDMIIKYGKMKFILESDGQVHGSLETPTKSTIKRNADFMRAGLDFVLINHESISELLKIFKTEKKLNGVSTKELTEFIATYLAWQEYSKYICAKEEFLDEKDSVI